jgi:hypothetical protein
MSNTESAMTMIEPVIDHSLSLLPSRVEPGDIAYGILAALRRVRSALDEIGGYSLVSMLDAAIRDRLIIRNLRSYRAGEAIVFGRLPPSGATIGVAETIMVAAAETCLIYGADAPDVSGVLMVVFVLLDRLIETMGEAPEYGELARWLRDDAEAMSSVEIEAEGDLAASVH